MAFGDGLEPSVRDRVAGGGVVVGDKRHIGVLVLDEVALWGVMVVLVGW